MRFHRSVLLLAGLLLCSLLSFAQSQITIPAGTPEDQALAAISKESDAEKKAAMLQEFVQKFASNPDAVAYGNWQLAQMALKAGDPAQALEYGAKALAAKPDVLDILTLQVEAAQQLKDSAKVADYAMRGGAIINAASNLALQGNLIQAAYSTSKAAVIQLTRAIATSHGRYGIRCNTVSPGMTMSRALVEHLPARLREIVESETLTPYLGDPIDIAHAVAFLASDEARYINGHNLVADGGTATHIPGYAALREFFGQGDNS